MHIPMTIEVLKTIMLIEDIPQTHSNYSKEDCTQSLWFSKGNRELRAYLVRKKGTAPYEYAYVTLDSNDSSNKDSHFQHDIRPAIDLFLSSGS